MNKKKGFYSVSAMLVLFLFVATGCSKTTPQANQSGQNNNQPSNPANAGARGFNGMPDFGQPDRPADIRGVVKSITGNQAVILKMEQPAGGRNASSTPENPGANQATGAISLTGAGAGPGMGVAGAGRAGGFAGPGGPEGENSANSRTAMMDQLKAMSTGEETITIPVGIQMLKTDVNATTKKRESVEATLADITADKFITIWLNTSVTDKKVADFILIN
ncbi:MAG: hypothetical protein WC467_01080 [Patescibacteria group bacterium]